jgi:uncharacterized protein YdeI (YjbR/CyaY-like superfamily)
MATKKAPAKSAKKATAKSGLPRLLAVDAYIAKAQPFAQPILQHLRETMHEGAPGVTEAIKWSMPFFVYEGVILGNMAAFKAHCSLGLWGNGPELREAGVAQGGSMGSFGRITSLDELPPKKQLIGFVKQAAKKIAEGERTKAWSRPKVAKPESAVPEALAAALKKNKAAAKSFEAMAPGCRREYNDWISDAKREETRDKRVAQAVEWIAEGKSRNWKYEKC